MFIGKIQMYCAFLSKIMKTFIQFFIIVLGLNLCCVALAHQSADQTKNVADHLRVNSVARSDNKISKVTLQRGAVLAGIVICGAMLLKNWDQLNRFTWDVWYGSQSATLQATEHVTQAFQTDLNNPYTFTLGDISYTIRKSKICAEFLVVSLRLIQDRAPNDYERWLVAKLAQHDMYRHKDKAERLITRVVVYHDIGNNTHQIYSYGDPVARVK
jgi:hypothetical protein